MALWNRIRCACVCVCEIERDRERERETSTGRVCVCVCGFFYDCESSPGRTNVCTCAFMAAWASVAKCISILAYSHKSIRKTKTKQIMQKQGTRCLSYYMECAAECPPKAQNGTPDGAFPQIGHISLLYLAGKQNTKRVWKVEAEA